MPWIVQRDTTLVTVSPGDCSVHLFWVSVSLAPDPATGFMQGKNSDGSWKAET